MGDTFLSQDSEQLSLLRLQIYRYDATLVSTTSSVARSLNVALRKAARYAGKERDTESGLDYFPARYFNSNTGRFLSPDWSASPDTVPYADLHNPQSLNLYSYTNNNPLSKTDDDGHVPCGGTASVTVTVTPNGSSMSQSGDDCPTSLDLWSFQFQNWRQNFVNNWNQRIDAHAPPPQTSNDNQMLQDITNVMVGVIPGGISTRFGWKGGAKWRNAVKDLMKPGTHETIAGEVPTREEATQMIQDAGGTIQRGAAGEPMSPGEEFGHDPGGVSDHTYPHINYETPNAGKATVKVQP